MSLLKNFWSVVCVMAAIGCSANAVKADDTLSFQISAMPSTIVVATEGTRREPSRIVSKALSPRIRFVQAEVTGDRQDLRLAAAFSKCILPVLGELAEDFVFEAVDDAGIPHQITVRKSEKRGDVIVQGACVRNGDGIDELRFYSRTGRTLIEMHRQ